MRERIRRLTTLAMALAAHRLLRDDKGTEGGAGPGESRPEKPKRPREQNTYGLPTGAPLRARVKAWFRQQKREILGTIPTIGSPLPGQFPSLSHWDEPMARNMTPLIGLYWDEAGKRERERLGLDPAEWRVTDPHLADTIRASTLAFCQDTNQTTHLQLNDALARLRQELHEGLVTEGESIPKLTKRVQKVFSGAEKWRAERIAVTEASRAVHAAQVMSAAESGVVAGFEMLVSADACELCVQIASEVKQVPIGGTFAVKGNNPHYQNIKHPPIHPRCACTLLEVLKPEFGGPEDPEWGDTLIQPNPPEDYEPPSGTEKAEPQPDIHKAPLPIRPAAEIEPVLVAQGTGPSPGAELLPAAPAAFADLQHRYSTQEQLNAAATWNRRHFEAAMNRLGTKEAGDPDAYFSTQYYKGGDYRPMNRRLRRQDEMTAEYLAQIKGVDRAFGITAAKTPGQVTVWRQVDNWSVFGVDDPSHVIGQTKRDQAFMSTSLVRAPLGAGEHQEIRIKVPQGLPCMSLDVWREIEESRRGRGEYEVLFPRGSSLKFTGVVTDADGRKILEAEMIPPPRKPRLPKVKEARGAVTVLPLLPLDKFGWTDPSDFEDVTERAYDRSKAIIREMEALSPGQTQGGTDTPEYEALIDEAEYLWRQLSTSEQDMINEYSAKCTTCRHCGQIHARVWCPNCNGATDG